MPAAARKGDKDTGHGCWPPRPSTQGSETVFINNIPAHRQGDAYASHCCPKKGCHGSVLSKGCSSVFVDNKPQGRKGDPVACGGVVAQGSPDVFIGDDASSGGSSESGNTSGTGTNTGSGGSGGTGGTEGDTGVPPNTGENNSNTNPVDKTEFQDRATKHLEAQANDNSTGYCAKYVRQAIEAGGVPLDPKNRPGSAKDYGPYLQRNGFTAVPTSGGYTPQPGDVVVHQPYPGGSQHGHIAMYGNKQWISDFKQRDMYGGQGYRNNQNYVVYRKS